MIRMKSAFVLASLVAGASGHAFAAETVVCPDVAGASAAYGTGKAAAASGYLNLAFFSLDRAVRASAAKADSNEFVSALACVDQVQSKDALVDLPNYDAEMATASAKTKSAEGKEAIAHYAFRSALQRIAGGFTAAAKSPSALDGLKKLAKDPAAKNAALYDAALTGLAASANADYATAKPALRKAFALADGEKATFRAELKLALARALYATGEDAAAIAEYESLYKIGAPMQDALIESGWAHLRSKNYVKSIGLSYELSTGKLAQFFAPEANSIRAIGLFENCRYAASRNAISRFSSEYGLVAEWLKLAAKGEHSLYETAVARSEGAIGAETVPEKVWSMWSSSDVFVSLQSGIRNAFAEERDAAEWIAEQESPKTKAALAADLKLVSKLRARAASRIESHLAKLDASMAKRIARESERLRFVRIEASQGAGRDLVFRNANPGLAEVEKQVAKEDRKAKSYRGKLAWGKVNAEDPSAEMWIDEIGSYEAATLDRCKAKVEYKKLQANRE
ncbi:MAG: hypothetical protein JST04_09655 [Bdellovibrionales bacterium]|nr:hypothetical protein [Bdellovibrionales bacterium]